MISKEYQQEILERFARPKSKLFPIVHPTKGTVVLSDPSRIEAFERAFPNFVCYRRMKNGNSRYIDSQTDELWEVIVATPCGLCGCRIYKVIIDSTIDEEVFRHIVMPCFYECNSIKFFD